MLEKTSYRICTLKNCGMQAFAVVRQMFLGTILTSGFYGFRSHLELDSREASLGGELCITTDSKSAYHVRRQERRSKCSGVDRSLLALPEVVSQVVSRPFRETSQLRVDNPASLTYCCRLHRDSSGEWEYQRLCRRP